MTPVYLWGLTLGARHEVDLPVPECFNAILLVRSGPFGDPGLIYTPAAMVLA